MPRLDPKNLSVLAALRDEVPAQSSWNAESYKGCWQGGKVYRDRSGTTVFLPLTEKRSSVETCNQPGEGLTFLGWGFADVKGWAARGFVEQAVRVL